MSGKRRGRKEREGGRDVPAAWSGPADRIGPRLVAEKIEILKVLRALDSVGADPAANRKLGAALVRLAEYDQTLTEVLDLLDRTGSGEADAASPEFHQFASIGQGLRGQVLATLPAGLRDDVREALAHVSASEPEVWMQVDDLRRRAPLAREPAAPRRPLNAREAGKIAARTFPAGPPPDPEGDAKVAEQERLDLPTADEVEPWLETLPEGWLRAVARMHDVDADLARPARVAAIAPRLRDATWLETALRDRIGKDERRMLAGALALGEFPMPAQGPTTNPHFDVPWDWEGGLPPSSGGKCRALGLFFVGARWGCRTGCIPVELRGPLRTILTRLDPEDVAEIDAKAGAMKGKWERTLPDGDPILHSWKGADADAEERLSGWFSEVEPDRAAIRAFFGRQAPDDDAAGPFIDFVMADFRARPGAPTLLEYRLSRERSIPDRTRAVLDAWTESRTSLYRVESVDPGRGATVLDVFLGGEPAFVTDPAFSTIRPGDHMLLRVYPAGPHVFAHAAGDALAPPQGEAVLGRLVAAFEEYASATGRRDRSAFLDRRPEAVHHAARDPVD